MKFKIDFILCGDAPTPFSSDSLFGEFEAGSGTEAELLLYKRAVSACEYFNLQAQKEEELPGFFALSMEPGSLLTLNHWVDGDRIPVGTFRLYRKVEDPQKILEMEITRMYLNTQMRRWAETYGEATRAVMFRIEINSDTQVTSYNPTVEDQELGSYKSIKEAVVAVEEYLSDTYG